MYLVFDNNICVYLRYSLLDSHPIDFVAHLRICIQLMYIFDFHVTVHRDKFLIIKPTRFTNFSNLFLG